MLSRAAGLERDIFRSPGGAGGIAGRPLGRLLLRRLCLSRLLSGRLLSSLLSRLLRG